jgi:hypothetical protein
MTTSNSHICWCDELGCSPKVSLLHSLVWVSRSSGQVSVGAGFGSRSQYQVQGSFRVTLIHSSLHFAAMQCHDLTHHIHKQTRPRRGEHKAGLAIPFKVGWMHTAVLKTRIGHRWHLNTLNTLNRPRFPTDFLNVPKWRMGCNYLNAQSYWKRLFTAGQT